MDKIFVEGMFVEMPESPDWLKAKLSIKVPDLTIFLKNHQNAAGYVNIDIKQAKSGKVYAELNTWKPTDKKYKTDTEEENRAKLNSMDRVEYPEEEVNPEDIPF